MAAARSRRNGAVEIEQAPVPAPTDVWPGPVAVLVDPDTASAAEMIAGTIAAYDRGVVVGARTFGKGRRRLRHLRARSAGSRVSL
jgi:carboxyl-terminal processing protease